MPEVAVGTVERARGDGTEGGLSSHKFRVCRASLQASRRRRLLKLECELRGAGNRARVRGKGPGLQAGAGGCGAGYPRGAWPGPGGPGKQEGGGLEGGPEADGGPVMGKVRTEASASSTPCSAVCGIAPEASAEAGQRRQCTPAVSPVAVFPPPVSPGSPPTSPLCSSLKRRARDQEDSSPWLPHLRA